MDRRSFIERLGGLGLAGAAVAAFPWVEACSPAANKEVAREKARIGLIGPGSRGYFHLENITAITSLIPNSS